MADMHAETPFDVPPGKATGCLPRETRYGEICDTFAEAIGVVPRDRWAELIGQVDLRPFVKTVLDQNGYGSCASESSTGGAKIVRERDGFPFVELNPWSVYRVTSGGRDNGSGIDANLMQIRDVGILPEDYWPRSKGLWTTPPAGWEAVAANYQIREFFDIRDEAEVGSALLKGFPIVFGWRGHSCVLTSLLSPTVAAYLNSWGEWGDGGFGKIYLRSINFGYGAWALRVMSPQNGGL